MREQLYYEVARAWCLTRFTYDHANPEQRESHINYDAKGTADQQWLREAVEGFVVGISRTSRYSWANEPEPANPSSFMFRA